MTTRLLGPSQRGLHARPLQLRDRRLEGAALFPLFEGEGRIRAVMVTDDESGRISVVNARAGLFTWRVLGANRLRLRSSDLRDVESPDDWALEDLWHFDPWWELGQPRYASHPGAPSLKRSNLAGYAGAPVSIWFDSGLACVSWVATGSGESWSLGRFSPSLLARAQGERPRECPRGAHGRPEAVSGWRLNPFWEASPGSWPTWAGARQPVASSFASAPSRSRSRNSA